MITPQTYTSAPAYTSPIEPTAQPVAITTGELYTQLRDLQNIYLLTENPQFVQTHGRLMRETVRELIAGLNRVIEQVDPLVLEALSSHPG